MYLAICIIAFVSMTVAECSNCGCQSQAYIESLEAWKQSHDEWKEELAEWKRLKESGNREDCSPPTTAPDVTTAASTTEEPSTTSHGTTEPTIPPSSTAHFTTTGAIEPSTQTQTERPIPVFGSGQCKEVCLGIENGTILSEPVGFASSGAAAKIHPEFAGQEGINIYCDCSFGPDEAWMVFQRRMDGSVDFNRYWDEYVGGFGNPFGEFWLGLESLSNLTAEGEYELKIDLQDWDNDTVYAVYGRFSIGGPTTNYAIQFSGYSGTAGDAFNQHSGDQFSTRDRDNDMNHGFDCAGTYTGGWWFNNCHPVNLNGEYYHGGSSPFARGIHWSGSWHSGYSYSLKASEMKFRRINLPASTTAVPPTSTNFVEETTSTFTTTPFPTTKGANHSSCEIKYKEFCFWSVVHERYDVTFAEAESICANNDSSLANIYDAEQDTLVREHLRSKLNGHSIKWLWTGMTINPATKIVHLRDGSNATYEIWFGHDGSLPFSYPSRTNILQVVHDDPSSTDNGWVNYNPEDTSYGALCERTHY